MVITRVAPSPRRSICLVKEKFEMNGINPSITRIAPSPTGSFHLGTARTAYMNYLEARSTGGLFILRIDDTDVERNKTEHVDVILKSLEWLGLDWDEIHFQSERLMNYIETAEWLLEQEKAFTADNGAIILKGFLAAPEGFCDSISGNIPITATNLEQINNRIVLMRGNGGGPTYQFASVVDDYEMGVDHIIRGVDHITNTPKQIAIWQNLEYNALEMPLIGSFPKVSHLGLINKDGKKLSKRDGAASLLWYKEQGYQPEAMLDWMLRMGWSLKIPRGDTSGLQKIANDFISKEAAIELFPKGTLKNSPCNYSLDKLNAINKRIA